MVECHQTEGSQMLLRKMMMVFVKRLQEVLGSVGLLSRAGYQWPSVVVK
jgi:hypothetical protein